MNEDLIAALNAERYGPSLWWKHDEPARRVELTTLFVDDSEATCARRRKALLDEVRNLPDVEVS